MKLRLLATTAVFLFVLSSVGHDIVHAQGTSAGDLDGQVVDGSPGSHPGIVGATVCFMSISGCEVTNSTGGFLFQNVAAGQYAIQVTASGFNPSAPISVNISTGTLSHAGQIGLQPVSPPWYIGSLPFVVVSIIAVLSVAVNGVLVYRIGNYKKGLKPEERN